MNKYRTDTILAIPILNKNEEVEGVIVAVNKKSNNSNLEEKTNLKNFRRFNSSNMMQFQSTSRKTKEIFSKKDEGLLEMISKMAGHFMRSTVSNRKQSFYLNTLRQVVKLGTYLNSLPNLHMVLGAAEMQMIEMFSSGEIRTFLLHPNDKTKAVRFERIVDEGKMLISGKFHPFDAKGGIVGSVMRNKKVVKIGNGENHPDFNGKFSKFFLKKYFLKFFSEIFFS